MRKTILIILINIFLLTSVFSCSKTEEKPEDTENKERIKNTFTDYVDTGRKTIDQAKELNKAAEKKNEEMQKLLDEVQ